MPSPHYCRSGEWGDHVTLQAAADSVRVTNDFLTYLIVSNFDFKELCVRMIILIFPLLVMLSYKNDVFAKFYASLNFKGHIAV